jgi:DHA1 family inner membrane transport protein
MEKRNDLLIFILTLGVFGILNTEFGIVGLLPVIADHFHITITRARSLVSLFALAVAISGPILIVSNFETSRSIFEQLSCANHVT